MSSSLDELLAEFEVEEDVVGLWQVFGALRDGALQGHSHEEVVEVTLVVVRRMLAAGFRPGSSPYSASGFEPWPSLGADQEIARIEHEWKTNPKTADLEGIWFLPPKMNN